MHRVEVTQVVTDVVLLASVLPKGRRAGRNLSTEGRGPVLTLEQRQAERQRLAAEGSSEVKRFLAALGKGGGGAK